jgi:pimeloyl-ACP methyl ester carboxylesterase
MVIKLLCILSLFCITSCTFKKVVRTKDVSYYRNQKLNVFTTRHANGRAVVIFIHGGSWRLGDKSLYNFLGNRLARKGIVSVVINYPLGPTAKYWEMAVASAQSIKWVYDSIENYGGEKHKIFVAGHSAGGHLAALVSLNKQYLDSIGMKNVIHGTILIDPAGLDVFNYLKKRSVSPNHVYSKIFTTDSTVWKKASPISYIDNGGRFLIYTGKRTSRDVTMSNGEFIPKLRECGSASVYRVQNKKHIPMITQFFWTWNPIYDDIKKFMDYQK